MHKSTKDQLQQCISKGGGSRSKRWIHTSNCQMCCHSTNILPHTNSAREGRTTKQFSAKRLDTTTSMITEPLLSRRDPLAGEYAFSIKPTSARKKEDKKPNIPSKKTPSTFRSAGARTSRPGTWWCTAK
jgi:hypothetical protein